MAAHDEFIPVLIPLLTSSRSKRKSLVLKEVTSKRIISWSTWMRVKAFGERELSWSWMGPALQPPINIINNNITMYKMPGWNFRIAMNMLKVLLETLVTVSYTHLTLPTNREV